MRHTLAIDFGSRYIGVALVGHPGPRANQVKYAATVYVDPKRLSGLVEPRAMTRRLRRSKKTHRRRLRRLAQSLAGIPGIEPILHFCRRRGFTHDEPDDADETTRSFQISREAFFTALTGEIEKRIALEHRQTVLDRCAVHLNRARRREAELRPARFDNRGPSRCVWEGCTHHVARAENDFRGRLRQALFNWMRPVFAESGEPARLRQSVEHWIGELDGLARGLRRIDQTTDDPTHRKTQHKPLDARIKRVFKILLDRIEREAPEAVVADFAEKWKEHYRRGITDIVRGRQGGRVRYCKRHSLEFVDYALANKVIPHRIDVTEADLVSRKQQILFRRLWRLIEARLLPLAGGTIDRVVVERVAFDILAGPFKARLELSETQASEMYWHGPMLGFQSRLEMLTAEFGNRCAYCGTVGAVQEVEHLLPRSAFPFDSYFNVVPACNGCNTRKGSRTALEAGLTIHPDAYQAFADYVRDRRVPHVYHTVKKGLLNLLQRPEDADRAERHLGMIAENLVSITNTQRSPRPLARYFGGKLAARTGTRPAIGYQAGRHTALYRQVMFPGYDKAADKEAENLRNHAIDAAVLGCELPSAPAFENRKWFGAAKSIQSWLDQVRGCAPETLLGVPRVEATPAVTFFEQDLGGGYVSLDLNAFNWNQERKATHKLDPYGWCKSRKKPMKRDAATAVLESLKDAKKRNATIQAIAHPVLRSKLAADPTQADKLFENWLRTNLANSLRQMADCSHPADIARRRLTEAFVNGQGPIPPTVGIRMLVSAGVGVKLNPRVDSDNRAFQYYQTEPSIREVWVCYREKKGQLDVRRPIVLNVKQGFRLEVRIGGAKSLDQLPADSPLFGRPLGAKGKLRDYLLEWRRAFDAFCQSLGVKRRHRLARGCVIEKEDGTLIQIRNFAKDADAPWMKGRPFESIRRVFRSPLQAMEIQPFSPSAGFFSEVENGPDPAQ